MVVTYSTGWYLIRIVQTSIRMHKVHSTTVVRWAVPGWYECTTGVFRWRIKVSTTRK